MKAIVKRNSTDHTFSYEQVPIPQIADDELLIRIHAIGVGIHDSYFLPPQIQFPYPIGIEAAGVIDKLGRHVQGFSIGDRIAFVSMMQSKGGTWAEYAAVTKDSLLLKIPHSMSFTTAAAIPVAGNTVLKAVQALALQKGDSLFIAGASGAIGTFAIQLAAEKGISIAASASEKNHTYMKSLGADLTVDYNDPDWHEQVKNWKPGGVDAALAIQPGTGVTSMEVVKNGGAVLPVSGDQFTSERNITVIPFPYQANIKKDLEAMMDQIAVNRMQVTIEKIYPFTEGLDALQKTTTRHARGKLVIHLDG